MSYSTYPIKLHLFQLILPTVISALKGLADLKKERKRKERGQKSQRKRKEKDNQVLILRLGRYVIPKEQL